MGYTLRGAENIVTEGPILDSPKQYHLIVQHISHRPYHSNETVHNVQFFFTYNQFADIMVPCGSSFHLCLSRREINPI